MTAGVLEQASLTAQQTLLDRCRTLGLVVWRCDNSGLINAEPREPGPTSMLWGTRVLSHLVGELAKKWGSEESPDVEELFEGAFAIPLVERRRRTRIGTWVCLGLSPAALTSEHFLLACDSAQVDAKALAKVLSPRARYDAGSARSVRDTLVWMAADLRKHEEQDTTIRGFTRQLGDAFETVDLLYSIGRSMNDLTNPEAVITTICDRSRSTLAFGWVGACFLPTARLSGGLAGRHLLSGPTSYSPDALQRTVARVLAGETDRSASVGSATIVSEVDGVPVDGTGQVLVHPILRGGEPVGAVVAGDKGGDDPQVSSYDTQLLQATAGYLGAFLDNALLYEDQRGLFMGTLEALTAAIDAKDPYTRGHSQRVAHLSQLLALAVGMSPAEAERVRIAGLVHDVGKIGVPEAVLGKPGKLSDEEFAAIKKHPEIGHRILKDIRLLEDVLPGVLHHHERWDGRGYPHGLSGAAIPRIARLISLADTFDAMSSNRSYRQGMPRERVLAEMVRSAGTQLDPELVPVFTRLDLTEYDRMAALSE